MPPPQLNLLCCVHQIPEPLVTGDNEQVHYALVRLTAEDAEILLSRLQTCLRGPAGQLAVEMAWRTAAVVFLRGWLPDAVNVDAWDEDAAPIVAVSAADAALISAHCRQAPT